MIKRFFVFILLMALSIRPAYFVGMVVYYETHLNEIVEKYCISTKTSQSYNVTENVIWLKKLQE